MKTSIFQRKFGPTCPGCSGEWSLEIHCTRVSCDWVVCRRCGSTFDPYAGRMALVKEAPDAKAA